MWDTVSHQAMQKVTRHAGAIKSVEFHPNGEQFLTASQDATVRLWDLQGRLLATFEGHRGPINMARFTADGKRIVTASSDRTARIWIVEPGELLQAADTRLAPRRFASEDLEPYRALLGPRFEVLLAHDSK